MSFACGPPFGGAQMSKSSSLSRPAAIPPPVSSASCNQKVETYSSGAVWDQMSKGLQRLTSSDSLKASFRIGQNDSQTGALHIPLRPARCPVLHPKAEVRDVQRLSVPSGRSPAQFFGKTHKPLKGSKKASPRDKCPSMSCPAARRFQSKKSR